MAQRIIAENAHVSTVSYSLPNKHYIPVDMKYIGVDNTTPCVFLSYECFGSDSPNPYAVRTPRYLCQSHTPAASSRRPSRGNKGQVAAGFILYTVTRGQTGCPRHNVFTMHI